MLNYYELMNLVNTDEAIRIIREDFQDELAKNFQRRPNKTTRRQAINAYGNNKELRADKEHSYLFGTGCSIFYSNTVNYTDEETGKKTADYAKVLSDLMKEMKPQDEYIDGCIAIARSLGWSPAGCDKKYYIEVEGNTYNMNLVYQLYSMIADPKKSGGVEVFTADKFLIMRSRYGLVALLPFRSWVNPYTC